ncbi:MAG: protein kinase [Kofleriaceae bacterium]
MPADSDGDDATRSRAPEVVSDLSRTARPDSGDFVLDEPERYVFADMIGAGGMGVVVAARGERLGRPVAVKMVTAQRADLITRFEREARFTARLQHPAIVPVYGTGRNRDGRPFYAMKHVTGEPLDKVIANTATLDERIALLPHVIAASEAIAYAHSERVIHRDLKPANILVGNFGETVVIDWGLAKELGHHDADELETTPYRDASGASDGTALGKVMGTPAFMPIEQARGESVDERADVYALGAILYNVLAGRTPFARDGEASAPWETVLARVLATAPDPLDRIQPGVPPDLLTIVRRAMAKAPADRYPSARELAADLKRFQTGQLVGAHRYSTFQLLRRWARRHRATLTVASLLVVILAVVGVVSVQRIRDERTKATDAREDADRRRVEADTRRIGAQKLMDFMLVRLRDDLEPIGKLGALEGVSDAIAAYYRDSSSIQESTDDLRNRSRAFILVADVEISKRDPAAAKRALSDAVAIDTEILQRLPGDLEARNNLGRGHERLASALQFDNDLAGADAALTEARGYFDELVREQPDVTRWKRNLCRCLGQLSKISRMRGRFPEALAVGLEDVRLAREVRARDPRDETDYTLAEALQIVGQAQVANARNDDAIASYEESVRLVTDQLAKHPDNMVTKADRVFVLHDLGRLQLDGQHVDAARRSFTDEAETLRALVAHDPANTDLTIRLAGALEALADTASAAHDLRKLNEYYGEALRLLAEASARAPDAQALLGERSLVLFLSATAKNRNGDRAGAIAALRDRIAVLRDWKDPEAQRWAGTSFTAIAYYQVALGQQIDAAASFGQASTILEEFARTTPSTGVYKNAITAYEGQADVRVALRDEPAAAALYRSALTHVDKVRSSSEQILGEQWYVQIAAKLVPLIARTQPAEASALTKTADDLRSKRGGKTSPVIRVVED